MQFIKVGKHVINMGFVAKATRSDDGSEVTLHFAVPEGRTKTQAGHAVAVNGHLALTLKGAEAADFWKKVQAL